ncbi:MAG: penicillin-binding protein 2 [Treponema sp.]|jgi:penicillin-binding protein 2|nr:penicillin-binding protein 2 [Treponema sp.]
MFSLDPSIFHPRRRIIVLQILFVFLFGFYSYKAFTIQILKSTEYQELAQNIIQRVSTISAQRGEIYDRSFTDVLAMSVDTYTITIIPADIPSSYQLDSLIEQVARIASVPPDHIRQKIDSAVQRYQPVEVVTNVPFSVIASLAERKNTLPGVSWITKPTRTYNNAESLVHVVGYIGEITSDELTAMYNSGYKRGDIIGKSGIEKQYDSMLRGTEGKETRTVDVRGRNISSSQITREPAVNGKNLVLTIDRNLQTLVEKALGPRIGAAVVLRPATGEILALVSYPWYDPNVFTNPLGSDYQTLVNDPNKPLINRTIQSSYPPASTFKIIMTTGILAEKAFPAEQTVFCPGVIRYGGRLWHCHLRTGHGIVNLRRAMAQSCDIYYWVVGRDRLRIENILNYATEYGYGSTTGIDLPNESAGFIPTPQWKERTFYERWQEGDTMNMAIGQGYTLVTPLQMANMTAMVVNDGVLYQPHLLKEIRNPVSGAVEQTIEPTVSRQSTIDKEIFEAVRRDMRSVITEGTAQFPLNIRSVEVAGKTGTGEVGLENRWHSWFTAFAPYQTDDPQERIVLSVIVEATNQWEWWATYSSAIILQGIFAHQSYEEAVRSLGFQYLIPTSERRD